MAGSMSDYLENKILDHILSAVTYTPPVTLYVGLWTAALNDASTGSTAGEVSGGNYSRVALTNNVTNFPAAVAGSKSNGTDVTFPTASASWGTVTHVAILDAAAAGNILYHADLTVPKLIGTGDIFKFPVGSAVFNQG